MLYIGLGVFGLIVAVALARSAHRLGWKVPSWLETGIGFVTNFFDTLGIGSFAPTTSMFKLWKIVPDEKIPGTLNVGHALPTVVEAYIFIAIVNVDPVVLALFIVASILGAWLGAGVVARWSRRAVQIGMGGVLVVAASLFLMSNLNLFPAGGNALTLNGPLLWIGLAGNFALGALMTLGIGLYAPCLILVSLLGMNPKAAFPIMMGSCAFLMPVASLRFMKFDAFSLRAALGLTLGGIPGVLIAAYLVKSMSLVAVRWLVIVVVLYAAIAMLRSAIVERGKSKREYEFGVKSVQVDSLADQNAPGSERQVMLPKQPGNKSLNP
ncbi:MAG: sulfite exporter TauE/SafE family protein [Candidatus Eremiobacteraeota bacterium]|nr:sulfite exporter TauE/SafE family protein [Candidatus Eremiobacteraeota bacterium]MBV8283723.1 sulfite exporter TauE/SafE family protein [Candidatus Eremiobacteraeota bacterium]MBV8433464.1 sulfite exporter TauE/SafE family protein [Candidatus Eremiobacteraeota bacterium]MBV8583092.1 sulfite exporter TauE/SafE family protein [Candidatus Eremiobacteraeota bacterium]